jgi:hypothetical protein
MRGSRRGSFALLFALALAGAAAVTAWFARPAPERTDLGAEEWRQDLAFIARELPRRHADAFHHLPERDFERAVADLDARIPDLEPSRVVVELVRLVARVGDLHTRLSLPASFRRLPLELEWFEDELRVTAASQEYSPLLGARVLAIGDTSIEEVDRTLRTLVPQAENEWTFRGLTPFHLVRPEVLHAFEWIESPERVPLRVSTADAEPSVVIVKALGEPFELTRLGSAPPHLLANPDQTFWWSELPGQETVYVRFRGYEHVAAKTKELSSFLSSATPRRLVVDMRDNRGGDFTIGREHLIPVLRAWHEAGVARSWFVIVGRRTLSAAMTNSIDMKTSGAVLVGEPMGERPNSYQEGRRVQLPSSGLALFYSIRYYRFLPEDVTALLPDVPTTFDWESYSQGRDPALEAIARGGAVAR